MIKILILPINKSKAHKFKNMATTTTQPTQEELFQLQHAIDEHIKQKENLHKIFKDSSLTYDIDTAGMSGYDFNTVNVTNMSSGEKKVEFTKKIEAFKKYFDDNFKQNSKLLQQYHNNIDTINKDLEEQDTKLTELKKERNTLSTDNSTNVRKLKESKKELNKQQYYQHMYIIVGLSELINVLILGLMMNKTIPKMTGLIMTFIVVLALAIYVIYYVFFKEPVRDVVSFDKFKFKVDKEYTAKLPACPGEKSKKRKQQDQVLQKQINNLINTGDGECEVQLTEDTRTEYLDKYNTTTTQATTTTQ